MGRDNSRIHTAFRFITLILFLVVFLIVYGYLPEKVVLYSDAQTLYEYRLDKQLFFYIALGSFLVTNIVLVFSSKILEQLNRVNESRKKIRIDGAYYSALKNWMASFSGVLNLNYLLIVMFVCFYNFDLGHYGWILYIGIVLILIWIYRLFKIFNLKKGKL